MSMIVEVKLQTFSQIITNLLKYWKILLIKNLRNEEIGHEIDSEKEKRKPSGRLRWGRTDPEMVKYK